jgi:hypothetical protein
VPYVDALTTPPPAGFVTAAGVSGAADATTSWSLAGGGRGTPCSTDIVTTVRGAPDLRLRHYPGVGHLHDHPLFARVGGGGAAKPTTSVATTNPS